MLHKPFIKQLKGGGGGESFGSFCVQCPYRTHGKKAAGSKRIGEKKTLNIYIAVNSVIVFNCFKCMRETIENSKQQVD